MFEPTPAAEWRRNREHGEIVRLESTGRVVRLRTVRPIELLRLGSVPDVLSELVIKMLYGQLSSKEYQEFFNLSERKEHALAMLESMQIVCTAALLEPKVGPGDDEILIDDLEDSELRIIFDLALLEASALAKFRERQEANVESVVSDESYEISPEQPPDSE